MRACYALAGVLAFGAFVLFVAYGVDRVFDAPYRHVLKARVVNVSETTTLLGVDAYTTFDLVVEHTSPADNVTRCTSHKRVVLSGAAQTHYAALVHRADVHVPCICDVRYRCACTCEDTDPKAMWYFFCLLAAIVCAFAGAGAAIAGALLQRTRTKIVDVDETPLRDASSPPSAARLRRRNVSRSRGTYQHTHA